MEKKNIHPPVKNQGAAASFPWKSAALLVFVFITRLLYAINWLTHSFLQIAPTRWACLMSARLLWLTWQITPATCSAFICAGCNPRIWHHAGGERRTRSSVRTVLSLSSKGVLKSVIADLDCFILCKLLGAWTCVRGRNHVLLCLQGTYLYLDFGFWKQLRYLYLVTHLRMLVSALNLLAVID